MKIFKKLFIFSFLGTLALFFIAFIFLRKDIEKLVASKIEQKINSLQEITVNNPNISLNKFTADSLSLYTRIPQYALLLKFDLEKLEIKPNFESILSSPALDTKALFYQGELLAKFLAKQNKIETLKLTQIKIDEHPLAKEFGFKNGLLNLQASGLSKQNNFIEANNIDLHLQGLELPSSKEVSVPGFPMSLKIPAFKDLNVDCKVQIKDKRINVENLNLTSSLFNLKGHFNLNLAKISYPNSLNLDLHLSEEAAQQYLSLLKLFSSKITNTSRNFKLALDQGRVKLLPQ